MASKSIDWDELLLTNDPKKKEIEVSFKKIDGEGNLISKGDEPGTDGGTIEDGDGGTPPTDDEGDWDTDDDTGGDGGPVDPADPPEECKAHDCSAYIDWLAAGNSSETALHVYSSPPTTAGDMWTAGTQNGLTDSGGNARNVFYFKSESGAVAGHYWTTQTPVGFTPGEFNPRAFKDGKGPCNSQGCLKADWFYGQPLKDQMSPNQRDYLSYPDGSLSTPGFDFYDPQYDQEEIPGGGGFSITARVTAGALIYPFDRLGNLVPYIDMSVGPALNNDLRVLDLNGNPGASQWGPGLTVRFYFGGNGANPDTVVQNSGGNEFNATNGGGGNRNSAVWLGLDHTVEVVTDYDTLSGRYQVRITTSSEVFTETGPTGVTHTNEYRSGFAYDAVFKINAEQHAPFCSLVGDFGSAYGQDFGTISTFITGGTSGYGSDSNQFNRPYSEMAAQRISNQDYVPPNYCSRIP